MITNDDIALVLKDIDKAKKQLKEVKKSIKQESKIENNEYDDLKKKIKILRQDMKQMESDHESDLASDNAFIALKELKMKQEEELANLKAKFNKLIAQMPFPYQQMQLKFESDEGLVNVMMCPQMKLFLNGKEEKL